MNDREAETYLNKNIKVVIEPMIGDLLEVRPDDTVFILTKKIHRYCI